MTNNRALCSSPEYNPEWWFPEAHEGAGSTRNPEVMEKNKETVRTAVLAMKICQECPLFANNWCLDYAMRDVSTIDYGIFASTLPIERRRAVNFGPSVWDKSPLFAQIRQQAIREGVLPVKVETRERPKVLRLQLLEDVRNVTSQDLSE